MKKAFVYIRVSTEEQAKDGRYSLDTQKRLCLKAAKNSGYTVEQIFNDAGRSATNMNRPALQDMLIACENNNDIAAIFVQDTDRLARNTQDHLAIRSVLKKKNIKLISVSQPLLDDSPEGNMIDTILASVNQFQSDLNSRKVKKSIEQKIAQGWFPGFAPYGYKNVTVDNDKKIIQIDESTAHFVTKAFKLFATGNYAVSEVNDILYEEGCRTRKNKKMPRSILTGLLKNPFYQGGIMRWKDKLYPANHDGLTDKQTFELVQQVLYNNGGKNCRRRKFEFLLRGYVYCICGKRYQAEHHFVKSKSYYRCSKPCGQKYILVDKLEDAIADEFKKIKFVDSFIKLIVEKLQNLFNKRKNEIDAEKKIYINQKIALENERGVIENKLFKGIINNDSFTRNYKRVMDELEQVQKQITRLERERNYKINDIQVVLGFCTNMYETYKTAPYSLKKQYLNLFWDRFIIENKKVVKSIPAPLFQDLLDSQLAILNADDSNILLRSQRQGVQESNPP